MELVGLSEFTVNPPPAPSPPASAPPAERENAEPGKPTAAGADVAVQLRCLLEITGKDSRAGKTAELTIDSEAITFHVSRRHEAEGLRQLSGKPSQVRNVTLPQNTQWELWTWGKLLVLVDKQGTTRYWAIKP
jgi:hypothetical protein